MNIKKIFLILFGVGVSVVASLIIFIYLSVNGGISGTIKSLVSEPNWDEASITSARNKTKAQLKIVLQNIENQTVFNFEDEYVFDYCVKGDHGWKRNDPFAYKCTLELTHFYSFNDNFRDKLVELNSVLVKEGFKAEWKPMDSMLENYYDDLKNSNFGRTHLVSSLPPMSYSDKNHWVYLNIDYSQIGSTTSDIQSIQNRLDDSQYNQVYSFSSPVKFNDIFVKSTKNNKYLLTVTVRSDYFSN
jgi:hypothetical protein